MNDIKELSFNDLERRFRPLIAKFSHWPIYGMDPDDIAQELRIVLAKAQGNYDPNRGESGFLHYLYRAMQNRMGQLASRPQRKKRVPPALQASLDDANPGVRESGFERVELEAGLSPPALKLVRLILDRGLTAQSQWREHLSPDELSVAVDELHVQLHD